MTNIQVAYWANQETKRHNEQMEALTAESNKTAQQNAETAKRTMEHNYEIGLGNLAVAQQNAMTNLQAVQNNYVIGVQSNQVAAQRAAYDYELGLARNVETTTHNLVTEIIEAGNLSNVTGSPVNYAVIASQRGGSAVQNTINQLGIAGSTVKSTATSVVNSSLGSRIIGGISSAFNSVKSAVKSAANNNTIDWATIW